MDSFSLPRATRVLTAMLAAVFTLCLALPVALSSSARAEDPFYLTDELSDRDGFLSDPTAVTHRLESFRDHHGNQLFVVLTASFSGKTGEQWAAKAADISGLGADDALLAIAPDDRAFGFWGDRGITSYDNLDRALDKSFEDAARAGKWDKAIYAVLDNLEAMASGSSPSGSGARSEGGGGAVMLIFAVVLVFIIVVVVLVRKKSASTRAGIRQRSYDDLRKEVGTALVAADDAVRSSANELAFAQAEFGLMKTDNFDQAVKQAGQYVAKAFHLRQLIDDDIEEPQAQRVAWMKEILQLTAKADQTLSAQEEAFAHLRDMKANIEQTLADLRTRHTEVSQQVDPARRQVELLTQRYSPEAMATLATFPAQAGELLRSAGQTLDEADRLITDSDRRGEAVPLAQMAQQAIYQAAQILEQVTQAPAHLEHADKEISAAIASLRADLEDVAEIGGGDAVIAERAASARSAIDSGLAAQRGGDTFAALQALNQAEDALDEALAPRRSQREQENKAIAALSRRTEGVAREINAIQHQLSSNRGAIGPEARTAISNAVSAREIAIDALADRDLASAHNAVNRAERFVNSARQAINADLKAYQLGGYGGRGRSNGGIDVGSFILGGIISSLGSGSSRSRGGFGSSGGWGSGRSSGGFGGFSGGGRAGGGRF